MSAYETHTETDAATFLLLTGTDAFRKREADSWSEFCATLQTVREAGTLAMGEISADITNSCMDSEDILL